MWIPTPPNPNEAEKSIVFGLSAGTVAEDPEVSPETIAGIQRDELKLARQAVIQNVLLTLLFVAGALLI